MSFKIESTAKTPEISVNQEEGIIRIVGISVPEDSHEFYTPMFDSIDEYLENPPSVTELELKLDYFNTSTALIIRNLLRKLEPLSSKSEVKIKWLYDSDDEDMMEAGSEFQYLFKDLNIEILGVN